MIVAALFLTSCHDNLGCRAKDGKYYEIEPYGWADADNIRLKGVQYRIVTGNVVWSVIGFETIGVPLVLTGWYLQEPVRIVDTAAMIEDYNSKNQ